MKYFLIFLAVALTAVSCVINIVGGTSVGHCTEEGIDYTEVRDVQPFCALASSLPCNVYYMQADKQEVRVESTEEFASKVLTEVEGGTLTLKLEPGRYPKLILRVVVSSPNIESLHVRGSGNLFCENAVHAGGDLDLKVAGSGDIFAGEIDSKDFSAHCGGSGSMKIDKVACTGFSGTVSGSGSLRFNTVRCAGFSAGISGSGNIAVQTLQADGDASARISGSGRIRLEEVTVDGDMDLKTSGSGDISVNGACRDVVATTSGSGSITGNLTHAGISTHTSGSGHVRL